MKRPVIKVTGVRCDPQVEERLNKWYDDVHIPMMLKFPGLSKVTRYKALTDVGGSSDYLAVYEFSDEQALRDFEDSPELAAARLEKQKSWKKGEWERISRIQYEMVKTWSK